MNKNLRLVLLAAIPLLVVAAILAVVFLAGGEQEPPETENGTAVETPAGAEADQGSGTTEAAASQSAILDEVVEKVAAQCGDYAVAERYETVYAICEKDGLRFRIDDTSNSLAAQVIRLREAMEFRCSSLDGESLRLNNLTADDVIISAYLVADREDYPDLRLLQISLNEAEYETRLEDACAAYEFDASSIRPASYAGTDMAAAIAALSEVGVSNCDDMSLVVGQFGYESVACGNDEESAADDFIVLNFADAERVTLDALADSLEFTVCDGDAVGKLIRVSDQLYVLGEDFDQLSETYRDLIERDGYQTAELVDTCDFQ
ncbi:hypothetical protein F4X86_02345 [Candidatus Saccharibacteria bacterium]|nr:hypothetical protein [Candidatus Saccharibacteria bacterium]